MVKEPAQAKVERHSNIRSVKAFLMSVPFGSEAACWAHETYQAHFCRIVGFRCETRNLLSTFFHFVPAGLLLGSCCHNRWHFEEQLPAKLWKLLRKLW